MPLRARFTVYSPGITNDITQFVSQCEACQKHQKRTQKEPLLQPELPCRPWERLSSEYRGQQHLLLSEHYSKLHIKRKQHQLPCHNKSYEKYISRTWNPLPAQNGQWVAVILLRLPIFSAYFFCLSYKCVYLLLFFVVIATISIFTFP